MSEMVERVGEALRVKLIEWYAGAISFEDGGPMLARAAIEAMRRPTDWMIEGGVEVLRRHMDEDRLMQKDPLIVREIIQAALGDG